MISFDKPLDFEGTQLCDELEAAGVVVNRNTSPFIDDNGKLWLDIKSTDNKKAQEIVKIHKAKPFVEPTIEEKLASVGLNLDDLKSALGL